MGSCVTGRFPTDPTDTTASRDRPFPRGPSPLTVTKRSRKGDGIDAEKQCLA
jgi:hypothetical protein